MSELASIEEIIAEAKAGRMFILVDDEDRENEGDLVIPAEHCDAAAVNFMITHGRGLLCLALEAARVRQLDLKPMAEDNATRHHTAFTVSIEAREGITTGISAPDRARTIAVASDPKYGVADIGAPGHVFPLSARDGGVLVRAGHTEAAVDIARLAGLNPAGAICEIIGEDGEMMRLPALKVFAAQHGLKIATIADLIAYRQRRERLVERGAEMPFTSRFGGEWKLISYRSMLDGVEHAVLLKGALPKDAPALVRMHALDVLSDVLGEGDAVLERAMRRIDRAGSGAVVLLRDPKNTSLSEAIQRRQGEATPQQLRDYGLGAQILLDLGIRRMLLLSNHPTRPVVGIEGYGLTIEQTLPIDEQ